MRLIITAKLAQTILLPINYHSILQGVIYRQIEDREFAFFLHNQGYSLDNRTFRLFTFSRLNGDLHINTRQKTVALNGNVKWQIGSAEPTLLKELGNSFIRKGYIDLMNERMEIEELTVLEPPEQEGPWYIKMISPVTVHQTIEAEGGRRRTQFYNPHDPLFEDLIVQNAKKKYAAYYKQDCNLTLSIRPFRVADRDKVITKYKQFIIVAWNGTYELSGNSELLQFLYNTGIGTRNAQGFGMFDVFPIDE